MAPWGTAPVMGYGLIRQGIGFCFSANKGIFLFRITQIFFNGDWGYGAGIVKCSPRSTGKRGEMLGMLGYNKGSPGSGFPCAMDTHWSKIAPICSSEADDGRLLRAL